jgi:hypothetical protein
MSNLSDIGFPVRGEQDINEMIQNVARDVDEIRCFNGFYYKFTDESGAEIYLQTNPGQELIGFNPHFAGKSRRKVALAKTIERDSSDLDGGFYVWANPAEENTPESGEYPFVFDVPDFRAAGKIKLPQNFEIQLTAFASNEFQLFENAQVYFDSQNSELKIAAKSFIPNGLFTADNPPEAVDPPRPFGIIAGEIKEFELKTNKLSGEKFYWFLIETLGGEIDVVADPKLVSAEPNSGGILQGQFWLSGKLLNAADKKSNNELFKSLIDD